MFLADTLLVTMLWSTYCLLWKSAQCGQVVRLSCFLYNLYMYYQFKYHFISNVKQIYSWTGTRAFPIPSRYVSKMKVRRWNGRANLNVFVLLSEWSMVKLVGVECLSRDMWEWYPISKQILYKPCSGSRRTLLCRETKWFWRMRTDTVSKWDNLLSKIPLLDQ